MNRDDSPSDNQHADRAAELIRQKIDALYAAEPNAKKELVEAETIVEHRSKHQQFIHELNQSGKSMVDIQKAWHEYYANLPDHEKHKVWEEFYAEAKKAEAVQSVVSAVKVHPPQQSKPPEPSHHEHQQKKPRVPSRKPIDSELRSMAAIKRQLIGKVQSREKLSRSSHVRSMLFGLGMGGVVVIILLFSFFNERIIAPFITPSRTVSSTPIITDPNSTVVGPEPKIIIPKINVEIPVVYDEPSIEEASVQKSLERGVLHYATTPNPGQTGNGVIFGHSSNNILNPGKYKFAFVLLSRLEVGDTFMLQKDSKRYVYRVYDKKVVAPTDVSVVGPADRPSTATLITCDPPGTTLKRLVVIGEQISPDPASNVASTVNEQTAAQPQTLPSDAPSLWERIVGWFT
jgi:sortase A